MYTCNFTVLLQCMTPSTLLRFQLNTYCVQVTTKSKEYDNSLFHWCTLHMGQCPAKSGLWGYNFITIKIERCTKQHIFAMVLRFPFKFRTIVPTPFLCVKINFCDLHIFHTVDTTIVNPAG